MVTVIKNLTLLVFLSIASNSTAQTYNHSYALINVYNQQRQNPHDFSFSYDVVNGYHTCNNNFEVISKVNVPTTFRFRIFINDVSTYVGEVALPALGRVYFDNAFVNCYSVNNRITIQIIP